MITLFRKLIVKEWFRFFFASFIVLLTLISVAELISGMLRSNVTTSEVLLNYLIELPNNLNRIFPISCLVASLFSINKLKNRNELTAIFASGFSRKNFLICVSICSAVVALLQFVNISFFAPYIKYKKDVLIPHSINKFKNLRDQGLRANTIGTGRIWFKADKYFFSFSTFDKKNNSLNKITLYYFDDNYKLSSKIEADRAIYINDNQWNFYDAKVYNSLNLSNFPEIKSYESIKRSLNETPDDFKQLESDITTLYILDLYRYIKKLNEAGINANEYIVIFLNKISSSLICIVLSLISALAIFNPNRRSSSFGKSVFFVFIFSILYWLINSYFIELGRNSVVNPYVSSFIVPFLFIAFLTVFFYRNKTLN